MRDDFLELLRLEKWKSELVTILIKLYVDVEWASYYSPREYDNSTNCNSFQKILAYIFKQMAHTVRAVPVSFKFLSGI